jgi:hypothetical protein
MERGGSNSLCLGSTFFFQSDHAGLRALILTLSTE